MYLCGSLYMGLVNKTRAWVCVCVCVRECVRACECACVCVFTTIKFTSTSMWNCLGLRPLTFWDCGFETHRRHRCLWVLCVVRYRSLRRADHSSRGVLPTAVRRCVWSRNLVNEEALAHWGGAVVPKTNKQYVTQNDSLHISIRESGWNLKYMSF
jgi:hypothetical protein